MHPPTQQLRPLSERPFGEREYKPHATPRHVNQQPEVADDGIMGSGFNKMPP